MNDSVFGIDFTTVKDEEKKGGPLPMGSYTVVVSGIEEKNSRKD